MLGFFSSLLFSFTRNIRLIPEPVSEEVKSEKRKLDKNSFKNLLGVFKFILPHKWNFIIGLICLFLSSILLLAFPALTGSLVDIAQNQIPEGFLDSLNKIGIALGIILAIQSIFSFFRIFLFAKVVQKSMADMRKAVFSRFLHLPISFYDKSRIGELMSRITNDVSTLQDAFSTTLAEFIRQCLILIVGIIILFVTNLQLTVFMLAVIPILVLTGFVFGKFIRKLSRKTQDSLADTNIVVEEGLQNIQTVKAYTSEKYELIRYASKLKETVTLALKTARFRGAFVSFIIFALFGGMVAVLWYGGTLVAEGAITAGDLLSFVIYTVFIGGSIGSLGDIIGNLQKAAGASERILELLEENEEECNSKTKEVINGDISFDEVSFAYPTRTEVTVLNNISFQVKEGEKIAFIGPSGAGKSTIVQLLLRFYQPKSGLINIGNNSIEDFDLESWRKNIAIVPQEIILFGGSIKENIAYGNPEASEEDIIDAAKKANAYDFIQSFPDRFDTLVGERGIKLSGGQKQRVAIARAILRNPRILILDEATSSLDSESESLVQEALEELMKDKTTIIIAHRLATVRMVDNIYVVDQGKIAESGNHDQLSSMESSKYKELLKLQFANSY